MIKLEKASLDSVEMLVGLLKSSFVEAYQDVHSKEDIDAYFAQYYNIKVLGNAIADPAYDIFFAIKAGKEVGVLVLHHHHCSLKPALKASELKQLYVLSSEYGTGLGKYLMEKTIKLVSDLNKEWVWLCVSDLNYRAQRFYQKMNFERIGEGPTLTVGTDQLASSVMLRQITK